MRMQPLNKTFLLALLMNFLLFHSVLGKKLTRRNSTSINSISEELKGREDSAIVILCRNSDRDAIKKTLINFEEQFNKHYHYPYIFLNDKNWEGVFKTEICKVVSGKVEFGKIPREDWDIPKHIDGKKMKKEWGYMKKRGIPYANSVSYRNMCRFFSRKFFLHPLTLKYKYYWRVEPGVKFHCPIKYDPFEVMAKNDYQYGFAIIMAEFVETITTLWDVTKQFLVNNKHRIPADDKHLKFMFHGNGNYNGLHFWTNFEIGSFDFLRSDLYRDYIEHLETSGGFYYERWGDAPVHSLAVGLFMDKRKVHYFSDIGYTHDDFTNCPSGPNCNCVPKHSSCSWMSDLLPLYLNDQKV